MKSVQVVVNTIIIVHEVYNSIPGYAKIVLLLHTTIPYFAEVKQGGMYMKILHHCLTSPKISHSAK